MIAYTVYGCDFKCGYRHTTNTKRLEKHEAQCWYNPANRTCKTCQHEEYYKDSAGYIEAVQMSEPPWWERVCKRGDGEPLIQAIYVRLLKEHETNVHLYGVPIPPVEQCPYWEKETNDG